MRRTVFTLVLAAAVGIPAVALGQWIRYPTADVPKSDDGSPDLTAPAPRLPDGKPDFSGIWRPHNPNRCKPGTGQFVECGAELAGSPLARNLGANTPRGLPYQPWAAALVEVYSTVFAQTLKVHFSVAWGERGAWRVAP